MTTENETNPETLENDEVETVERESVEDTINEVLSELSGESNETETDKNVQRDKSPTTKQPTSKEASEAARILAKSKQKGKKRTVVESTDLDAANVKEEDETPPPAIEPPARFPVEKKEWFNKQPREVQEEVTKGWNEIEAHTTKLWQELNRKSSRYSQLEQVVNHYMPGWNLKGITDVQAIAELCAAQDVLIKDPEAGAELLLKKIGITPEQLIARRSGTNGHSQQYQQQPQQNLLTAEQVEEIIERKNQQSQQHYAINSAANEIEMVRRETEADGRYRYPELWDAQYLQRVKPLVEVTRKTQPNVSWAEATKRAVQTLRIHEGKVGSPSSYDPRLSQDQEIAKAKAASVSIRGRGNPSIPSITQGKPGESVEDSVRAVFGSFNA